jgi:hypothetical protein
MVRTTISQNDGQDGGETLSAFVIKAQLAAHEGEDDGVSLFQRPQGINVQRHGVQTRLITLCIYVTSYLKERAGGRGQAWQRSL